MRLLSVVVAFEYLFGSLRLFMSTALIASQNELNLIHTNFDYMAPLKKIGSSGRSMNANDGTKKLPLFLLTTWN